MVAPSPHLRSLGGTLTTRRLRRGLTLLLTVFRQQPVNTGIYAAADQEDVWDAIRAFFTQQAEEGGAYGAT